MPAIVLGLDLNGLGVVRALGRAGVRVLGVDAALGHVGRASRYCREVVAADPCAPDALLEALHGIARGLDEPGILFPTMDDTVRILSSRRHELPSSLRVELPDAAMVTQLMEKEDLARLASQHGWRCPEPFRQV